VISNGILFARSKSDGITGGTITMADADTGTINGQFTAPGSFTYPVAVKDGIAYAFAACPDPGDRKNYRDYTRLYAFSVYQPPVIEWQKAFGGSRTDFGEFIVRTQDNGVITGGITSSSDGDIQGNRFHGVTDVVITKYRPDKTIEWSRTYGGSDGKSDVRQILTLNDGYIVAGESYASRDDISGHHGTTATSDIWIMKLDTRGNILWSKSIGGTGIDAAMWITKTPDKKFVLTGFTYSTDGDFAGMRTDNQTCDSFVMKIDETGKIEWTKIFGGSKNDEGVQIELSNDNSRYYIIGSTWSNDRNVANKNHGGNSGTADGWVFAIDLNGNLLWSECYGGSDEELFWAIDSDSTGNIFVTGSTRSDDGQIPSSKHGSRGSSDIWYLKLDQEGKILSNRCFGGSGDDDSQGIRVMDTGEIFLIGSTRSNDGDVTNNHGGNSGSSDIWLLKLDPRETILWQKCFGGSGDDSAMRFGVQDFLSSGDSDMISSGYIIGVTTSDDGDVTGNHGQGDMWIVKMSSSGGEHLW